MRRKSVGLLETAKQTSVARVGSLASMRERLERVAAVGLSVAVVRTVAGRVVARLNPRSEGRRVEAAVQSSRGGRFVPASVFCVVSYRVVSSRSQASVQNRYASVRRRAVGAPHGGVSFAYRAVVA